MHLYRLFFVLLLNISPAPFDKSTESIISQKFMEPFYYGDILMKCNSPMESWTFPIEYKYSPSDKSIESNRQKFMGSYYYGNIFLCLANEMQRSQWEAALFRSNIRILNLTNRSNRQKVTGPTTTAIFF